MTGEGTIRHLAVEGGCWALDAGDQRRELVNLERDFGPEFREDGLRVRFEGEVRDDVATVCQVGRNLELRSLEEVDP